MYGVNFGYLWCIYRIRTSSANNYVIALVKEGVVKGNGGEDYSLEITPGNVVFHTKIRLLDSSDIEIRQVSNSR